MPGCLRSNYKVLLTSGSEATIDAYRFLRDDEIQRLKEKMEMEKVLTIKKLEAGTRVRDTQHKKVTGKVTGVSETEVKLRLDMGIYATVKVHDWGRVYGIEKLEDGSDVVTASDLDLCIDKFYPKFHGMPHLIYFDLTGEVHVARAIAMVLKEMRGAYKETVTPDSPATSGHLIVVYPSDGIPDAEHYWVGVRDKINANSHQTYLSIEMHQMGQGAKWFYIAVHLRQELRKPIGNTGK
jgi:hypothetical protein